MLTRSRLLAILLVLLGSGVLGVASPRAAASDDHGSTRDLTALTQELVAEASETGDVDDSPEDHGLAMGRPRIPAGTASPAGRSPGTRRLRHNGPECVRARGPPGCSV